MTETEADPARLSEWDMRVATLGGVLGAATAFSMVCSADIPPEAKLMLVTAGGIAGSGMPEVVHAVADEIRGRVGALSSRTKQSIDRAVDRVSERAMNMPGAKGHYDRLRDRSKEFRIINTQLDIVRRNNIRVASNLYGEFGADRDTLEALVYAQATADALAGRGYDAQFIGDIRNQSTVDGIDELLRTHIPDKNAKRGVLGDVDRLLGGSTGGRESEKTVRDVKLFGADVSISVPRNGESLSSRVDNAKSAVKQAVGTRVARRVPGVIEKEKQLAVGADAVDSAKQDLAQVSAWNKYLHKVATYLHENADSERAAS